MGESAVVILLEKARAKRAHAERARRLARSIGDADVAQNLRTYAIELEQRALELEARAASIHGTATEISELTQENRNLIEEIKKRLQQFPPGPRRT